MCQGHIAWENPIFIWGHKITEFTPLRYQVVLATHTVVIFHATFNACQVFLDFHYVVDMPNKRAVHFDDFGSPQVCPDVVTVEKLKRT